MTGQDTLGLKTDELAERGREVEENKGSIEQWPNEDRMNKDIDGVAVRRPVESEVLLKIEEPFSRHWVGSREEDFLGKVTSFLYGNGNGKALGFDK